MKVARKHIIQSIENLNKNQFFPKYVISTRTYTGKDKKIGEFGFIVSILPTKGK